MKRVVACDANIQRNFNRHHAEIKLQVRTAPVRKVAVVAKRKVNLAAASSSFLGTDQEHMITRPIIKRMCNAEAH